VAVGKDLNISAIGEVSLNYIITVYLKLLIFNNITVRYDHNEHEHEQRTFDNVQQDCLRRILHRTIGRAPKLLNRSTHM
jgi:hypothetical protein